MANRFWVGGTGTWDASTTTHWASVTNGAGGASVPTSADDVFFDGNSGATAVVTLGATVSSRNLDFTGFGGTLTGGGFSINTSGPLVRFVTGMTVTAGVLGLTFNGGAGVTVLLTMGGKAVQTFTIQNNSVVQQQDALSVGGTLTLSSGSWTTNDNAVSCASFSSNNSNTRTITWGSSLITVTGTGTSWNVGTNPLNLTITANTAVVTMSGASVTFSGVINWNGLSLVQSGSGASTVTSGALANYTRTGTATKGDSVALGGDLTCTGTFSPNGNSVTNRIGVSSSVVGTARTVTAATVSASNVDISDVIAAGAANWDLSAITGLSGDAGGNSGITFTTSITQSNNLITPGTSWSNPALWPTRVPLPQDDVNFRGFSTSGQTISLDMNRLGRNVTFGTGTGGYTISPNAGAWAIYGNFATGTNTFWSGGATNGIALRGRGNHTISFAGSGMAGTLDILTPTGTYTLTRAVSMSGAFTLSQGTFNDGGFNVTCSTFASNNANTRALTMSGTWSLISTATITLWNIGSTGTLTFNAAGSTILIGSATASTRTFGGGGLTYGTLSYVIAGSTGTLVITGANTFAGGIKCSDATNARTLTLPSSTVTTLGTAAGWIVNGTAGKLMTVNASVSGTAATLSAATGTVVSDYLALKDSTAAGGATFYAGSHSTNTSNNTGWTFTDPSTQASVPLTTAATATGANPVSVNPGGREGPDTGATATAAGTRAVSVTVASPLVAAATGTTAQPVAVAAQSGVRLTTARTGTGSDTVSINPGGTEGPDTGATATTAGERTVTVTTAALTAGATTQTSTAGRAVGVTASAQRALVTANTGTSGHPVGVTAADRADPQPASTVSAAVGRSVRVSVLTGLPVSRSNTAAVAELTVAAAQTAELPGTRTVTMSRPVFVIVQGPTPATRRWTIQPEDRTTVIGSETRVWQVESEDRSLVAE